MGQIHEMSTVCYGSTPVIQLSLGFSPVNGSFRPIADLSSFYVMALDPNSLNTVFEYQSVQEGRGIPPPPAIWDLV